jgi:FAD dependent oxidoreductase
MTDSSALSPGTTLSNYRLPDHPLYLVGIFARGVTVYSQQIRAFNLIWALVEQGILACKLKEDAPDPGNRASIAIIGGGFAGLTAAAALLKKGVHADITIFEQRDTLLPLQHGSDTRWLHPRIYNWPADDSESAVADLPLLARGPRPRAYALLSSQKAPVRNPCVRNELSWSGHCGAARRIVFRGPDPKSGRLSHECEQSERRRACPERPC